MADANPPPDPGRSWLDDRLAKLEATYRRFGRDSLREFSMADVRLLLASKELAYRDAPKGRDLTEASKAENRRAELEIADLRAFMQAEFAGSGLSALQRFARQQDGDRRPPQPDQTKPKDRDRGYER